ncbi:hypothetical protein D3C85_1371310 [compost metagenome]
MAKTSGRSKEVEQGLQPGQLALLFLLEQGVQLIRQRRYDQILMQYPVHLRHLLAFELDPALLLQIIQRGGGPRPFSLIPLPERIEVHGAPAARLGGTGKQLLQELAPIRIETRQDLSLFQHELEAIFGKIAVGRGNDARHLQIDQQGLEGQLTDVGVIGEAQQTEFPLGAALAQDLEQGQDRGSVRGIPIDEVLQHR